MKHVLSILVAIAMMLSGVSACAEALPVQSDNTIPEVGQVVEGFEVLDVRDFALIGATQVFFEHQKTGAKVLYLANGDTNRVFNLTFLTRPIDNTGLPHVFEHSTLKGSEKYPYKTLFFNLSYQTYNTYMNASTYSMMTSYPISSLSEKQLLNYADFYTDSCLHPMILQDESIFREEAWRYRMESLDQPLTIEGTVYSEMLGATTLESSASMNMFRTAFPGSVVGFSHGGDPDSIPDMTWESLKSYHELFYHPSNSIAFLYGQFEDYTAFLALLNEAYSAYERTEFKFSDSNYKPITEPVVKNIGFPMEAGSSTEHNSMIYYAIVCPGLRENTDEEMIMNTLTDLMLSASSPLRMKLNAALPYGQFGTYIETTAPDDAIVFYAANVNKEDGEVLKKTVDEALTEIAAQGFSQDMVDAVMASVKMSALLTTESSTVGLDAISSIAYSYATSGNVHEYADYVDALSMMDTWNQEGLYQAGTQKWLINNPRTALVTTYPELGQKEANDAALAEKLAAVKAAMSPEEQQAVVDATNAKASAEDTSEAIASVQAVTVASLPEEIHLYDVADTIGENGVRKVTASASVDEVGQVALFLDAKGLPKESIHWFKLFTTLIGEVDTDKHSYAEIKTLRERYLYNGETRLSLMDSKTEDYLPYLRMGWIAMDEDQDEAFDLMYEIVFGSQFTDTGRITELVQAANSSLRSTINNSAPNVLLYRAFAVNSPLYRYYNYFNYLEFYDFLEEVELALSEHPETVTKELQAIQSYFMNRTNAVIAFAGNDSSLAVVSPLADAFMNKLESRPIEHVQYDLPIPAKREALILDINIQFNALVADYQSINMEKYDSSLDAISTLISDTFLIPLLRDQYGVYTPFAGSVVDGGIYLLTYRDPNIQETFTVYDNLPDMIAGINVEQDELDGYILSSYAYYATSSGELSGAIAAAVSTINGDNPEDNLEYMHELKAVTPEKVQASAEIYRLLSANGIRSTAGSASMINANAELYDVILNPFNAKDTTEVEFTDATEENGHYAAVRFVYENGLMAPISDTAFGVDEPATAGDMANMLCALVQIPQSSAADAVNFWISYGVMPADMTEKTILTNGMSENMMVQFGSLVGLSLTAEPDETSDLAQSRGALAEMAYMLFGE